jgi:hypothetical protein
MSFHLAGIIPVSGPDLNFNMPWHDSLMPIGQDYLAIERAVVECAYAGCETIWVVCNDDIQPLIRYRLGDYVQDPVWVSRRYEYDRRGQQKPIPIYYVPVFQKDRNKRDCLSWSVLHGATVATKISSALSQWLKPSKYFVSFPYGVYYHSLWKEHRKKISSDKKYMLSYNGETVRDGKYLGFTMSPEDLQNMKDLVYEKSTGLYKGTEQAERLSLEERFSYRNLALKDVFSDLKDEEYEKIEISTYWDIDSWENYCNYISDRGATAKRPSEYLLKYKEWNGIGIDNDE